MRGFEKETYPILHIHTSTDWRITHPASHIGILEISGVDNTRPSPALQAEKRRVEENLRQRYAGFTRPDFLALPVMAAYHAYYRSFDKTYHVLLQIESIVLKGKNLPAVSPLVEANFTAELDTLVLTAGHDVTYLRPPLFIDIARPGDCFTQMNGALKELKADDILMGDAQGIICTILYGQDDRSPITAATTHALYAAYAPTGVGVEAVQAQLVQIEHNIRLFAPDCRIEQSQIFKASSASVHGVDQPGVDQPK